MASYQQRNQYRKRSKKQFHNNPGHENSGPRAQAWARNKMRRGTKWSQHVHPGGPSDADIPPRQRRYPHYGQKRKFKHRIGGHPHYGQSRPSGHSPIIQSVQSAHSVHNVQSAVSTHSVQSAQSVPTPQSTASIPSCSDRESTVSASPVSIQSAGLEPQQLILSKEDSAQSSLSCNTTNTQKSSSKSRTSYTDIVQQAEQSKDHSKEQSKNPEDLEDEAVFMNVNNRKKMMYYQRKTPTPPPHGATMDLDDIEAQIARLELGTPPVGPSKRSKTSKKKKKKKRRCKKTKKDQSPKTSPSLESVQSTSTTDSVDVEAKIEEIERIALRADHTLTLEEDLSSPSSNTAEIVDQEGVESTQSNITELSLSHSASTITSGETEQTEECNADPSPPLSVHAAEFSPAPSQNCELSPHNYPQSDAQMYYNHAQQYGNHGPQNEMGYPPFFEHGQHGQQELVDGHFIPVPRDQNVNRWAALQRHEHDQHVQQEHLEQHRRLMEMNAVPPRHQQRMMRRGGGHHGHNGQHQGHMHHGPHNGHSGHPGGQHGHPEHGMHSHGPQFPVSSSSNSSPNTAMEELDGECFVSIDVECAATGHGHFDSAPCRIAMVDFFGSVIFDQIANVPDLQDPLTEFTGLDAWQIYEAQPLEKVLVMFHQTLMDLNQAYRHGVTIVGQSLIMDLIWADLKEGVHYTRTIDIAKLFRTKNERWAKHTYYSLRQAAWGLLNADMNGDFHDPTEDARVTMQLYRECCLEDHVLVQCRQRLQELKWKKKFPDFKVHTKYFQCAGMYNASRCCCGQETAVGVESVEDIEKLRTLYHAHRCKPVVDMHYLPRHHH